MPFESETASLSRETVPDSWESWLALMYPEHVVGGYAPYHRELWEWVWSLRVGHSAPPFVAVWSRGWGKSTSVELACAMLGARGARRYVLYVSGTQPQADDHVGNIAALLESEGVERHYPSLGERLMGKYGPRAWRRNRLRAASGFTVDAIGLDAAIRGAKLETDRPDLIVLDDLDSEMDGTTTMDRKVIALTRKILPAGSVDGAVLAAQNLVHAEGIFTRLVDGRADFLANRIVSGPHPALTGLAWEHHDGRAVLTEGTPTWDFMGLDRCQAIVDDIGIRAFLAECQHQIELLGSPRFSREAIVQHRQNVRDPLPWSALPEWARVPGLDIWELPRPTGAYVMYTDAAEGKGLDYTVTVVLEARALRHVATLRDNDREPSVHGSIARRVASEYGNPLWGGERLFGAAILAAIGQYPKLYWHEERERTMQQMIAGRQPTKRLWMPMTQQVRVLLIEELAVAIETHALTSPSDTYWQECNTFVLNQDGKAEASPGHHDDYPMAMAGALRMAAQPGAKRVASDMDAAPLTRYRW